MNISKYPLFEFHSELANPFQVDIGVSIIKNDINLNKIKKYNVSCEDEHHLKETGFCLQIDEDIISPTKSSIAFIISCRLLKSTKIFIRYRVNSFNEILKIRDDYPFNSTSNPTTIIDLGDLKKISLLYIGLNRFKEINTRTGNAVYFLGMAYRARGWLESLIFHVCALETLISSSTREKNITEKFKNRIHNFIDYDKNQLNEIYNIRSELVHGRYDFKSENENLRLNGIAEEVCRKVFSKILLNAENVDSFKIDDSRLKLFEFN